MISSTHPVFARLAPKLERAEREIAALDGYLALHSHLPEGEAADWARTTTIAAAVHNVYNGIEDILLGIAIDIDDAQPKGDAWHQALLDQMRTALIGRRSAVLDEELYGLLAEIKSFRHLVRHRYGLELDAARTDRVLSLLRTAWPAFMEAILRLERWMSAPADE